jgi:hypothetical protein
VDMLKPIINVKIGIWTPKKKKKDAGMRNVNERLEAVHERVSGRPKARRKTTFRKREDEEEQWAMWPRRRRLAEAVRPKEARGTASCRFALQGAKQLSNASAALADVKHEPRTSLRCRDVPLRVNLASSCLCVP